MNKIDGLQDLKKKEKVALNLLKSDLKRVYFVFNEIWWPCKKSAEESLRVRLRRTKQSRFYKSLKIRDCFVVPHWRNSSQWRKRDFLRSHQPWKPGKVQQNLSYQLKRMSILELRKVLFLQKVQREGGEEGSDSLGGVIQVEKFQEFGIMRKGG